MEPEGSRNDKSNKLGDELCNLLRQKFVTETHDILESSESKDALKMARQYLDDLRLQLDQEVAFLVREANAMSNIHAPIGKIPPEILSYIFSHHGDYVREFENNYEEQYAIMTVCRLWRDIALRTPALWSLIHLHWPKDVIQRFLERSGNYSLKVVIPRMVLSYGEAPDHLLRNLFLRANELVAFDESLDDGGNTWVSVPTPRLRRLDLSVDRAHGTGSLLIESIGTPPAELEHLELNCVNLLSAFSSCSKLQTLVLKGDVSATVEDWERFFDVAAQLPHLYNLSLVNKSFPLLGMDRVFELKSIHSLTIQSSKFEASIVALSTLVLPNLSFISVHFPEWKISSWYTLMLLLPRWKHVSCKFHIENWHGLDIELCEDKDLPFRTVHLAFDKVDGRIESRNEQAWINTCLRHRAFQSIPFHNISGIWLDGISISPWTGDMLLAFLKNFTPLLIPSTTTPSVNVPITPNEVVNRLGTFETGRAFDRLHLRFGRQESPQLEEADGEAPQDERTLTIWGSYIWNENSRLRV